MKKNTLYLLIGIPAALILLAVAGLISSMAVQRTGTDLTTMPGYGESVGAPESPLYPDKSRDFDAGVGGEVISDSGVIYPPQPEPSAGPTAAEVDQKIIKTGYLNIVVESVDETVTKSTALATGKGGFVQDSTVNEREDGTYFGSITVRVPSKEFETTMTEIKAFATVVKTESSSGQDVTEQYTDLEAQLRNARAQEAEYLEILQRAETVEEILMVQSYLSNIRYTIESLQGRIQYLENITTYSTISVALSEEPTVRIPTKEFRPGDTIKDAVQALVAIGQNVLEGLIYLVIIGGGLLIPLGLIAWGIVRIIRTKLMK